MRALSTLLQPRRFLLLAGTLLVFLGLAGVASLLGSFSRATLFNPPYWTNWVHLTLGIIVLAIAFAGARTVQQGMTLAAAILGSALGLLGLLLGSYAAKRFSMPELADPSEHLAHLTVGALALWAWSNRNAEHQLSA
jgi:FtsH-binding integral membrane protein